VTDLPEGAPSAGSVLSRTFLAGGLSNELHVTTVAVDDLGGPGRFDLRSVLLDKCGRG
jgi:hypothetical protein